MFRFHNTFRFVALLASLMISSFCNAGIVISIDRETALAGETILLGIYASSDSGDEISGFNLPFDYNSDGFVDVQNDQIGDLPAGFSLTNIAPSTDAFANAVFANTKLDRPFPQLSLINADFIATGSGDNIVLGNSLNPMKLFDVTIQVSPNVPVGTVVPFQIKVPSQPFSSLFLVAGPNSPTVFLPVIGTPATGSITIVAVPEPSSIVLLLSAAAAATFGVRWRRLTRCFGRRTT